jgi:hypothetical protein
MVLTREEKERLVLELLNKRTPIRVISNEAGMSFRDIGAIKKKAEKEKESKVGQAQRALLSSQAYKLFSEGKTPVQVAIELNLREPEVNGLCREYWNLVQLDNLNIIYHEIKHDIWFFVNLYRLAKTWGFRAQAVLKLLRIANNDLPSVEHGYENLKTEVNSLEEQKRNLNRVILDLNNQRTEASNYVEHYKASCRQEYTKREALRHERTKLDAIVSQFKNNDEEYLKIRRIAEEKVNSTLSDSKVLLKYALLSLVESMKKNRDKYSSLIYNEIYPSTPSTTVYVSQYYASFDMNGRHQQYPSSDYYNEDCIDMLVEEADKIYNKFTRECIDESIAECATSLTSSLQSLPPPADETQPQT